MLKCTHLLSCDIGMYTLDWLHELLIENRSNYNLVNISRVSLVVIWNILSWFIWEIAQPIELLFQIWSLARNILRLHARLPKMKNFLAKTVVNLEDLSSLVNGTIIFFKSFVLRVSINPLPVMSPDLHGPPAGPRRPGTMIFKCVEFLEQLKNKNSSYWLLHITTSKYLVSCEEHDQEIYGRKCSKNIYFSDKWKLILLLHSCTL